MLFEKLFRIIRSNIVSGDAGNPSANDKQAYHSSEQYRHSGQKKQPSSNTETDARERAYYDALEITAPATFEQIKASYKKLVRKYHPDLFQNNAEKRRYAEIVTQKINEAYAYFERKFGK